MQKLFNIIGAIFIIILTNHYYQVFQKMFNMDIIEAIKDSSKLETYYRLLIKRKFEKVENPKISIISPVYNREKYILRFLEVFKIKIFMILK